MYFYYPLIFPFKKWPEITFEFCMLYYFKTDASLFSYKLMNILFSLINNLFFRKNHQWNSGVSQSQAKTGGQNWNTKPAVTTTAPTLGSPISNGWSNAAVANNNAFNPFAAAIQPQNTIVSKN